jgi:soluble lytic murein transglycosylase-like protein
MRINLKSTILLSSSLAVLLNVGHFLVSYPKSKDAFFTSSAYADTASVKAQAAAPAKPSPLPRLSATAPGSSNSPSASVPTADAVSVAAELSRAGLRSDFASLYLSVQHQTGTPWQLLAAVHRAETGQSGNTNRSSYAGATGPMQFMPATFNHYALDGDGNGTKDITDVDDAMLTAGRYLAAGGASRGQYSQALYNYNHSSSYVSQVLGTAHRLGL